MWSSYVVWIDDQGIVKGLASSCELSDENIRAFIQNKPLRVRDVSRATGEKAAQKMDSAFILSLQPYEEQELTRLSSMRRAFPGRLISIWMPC